MEANVMADWKDQKWQVGMEIKYDFNFMMSDFIGPENGVAKDEVDALADRADAVHKDLTEKRRGGSLPFFDLPYQDTSAIKELADELANEFDNFVLLGIGGS